MGVVLDTVKAHHGATLSGNRWCCVCRADLTLPEESLLRPSKEEITEAWAAHLAERIIGALRRNGLLVDKARRQGSGRGR